MNRSIRIVVLGLVVLLATAYAASAQNWGRKPPRIAYAYPAGVRQGDPLGPLLFSLVLRRVTQHLQATHPDLDLHVWYLDDGQLFCKESHVDAVLRALDVRFASVGATRGTGLAVKSVSRVLGAEAVAEPRAWITFYVAASCVTPADDVAHLRLGATSSAMISTLDRRSPSWVSHERCSRRP